MVEVWLPYGETEVSVNVPSENLVGVVEPRKHPEVDAEDEVRRALENPIASKPLSELAQPGDKAVIVVDDHTRYAPSSLMVSSVLGELQAAGVKESETIVLFACGRHRATSSSEAAKLLGRETMRQVKVISHDARRSELAYMGKTSSGNDVHINKLYAEADVKVVTGDIELHPFAGYGGGRKSILPGISGEGTILANHSFFLDPLARMGALEDNPASLDMAEASHLAGADFALNVVLDGERRVAAAYAGDFAQVFAEGVKLVDKLFKVEVDSAADVVIASAGGHPWDINLYQGYKGLHGSMSAVKEDGVIILVAQCAEGYGNASFKKHMETRRSTEELREELVSRFELGGHKAYRLMSALDRAKIALVSVMPKTMVSEVSRLRPFDTVSAALNYAFRAQGRSAEVLVIPRASRVLPVVRSTAEISPE